MATTKGGIIIENIKIGDIHYEFEYGFGIKCEVITKPERTGEGYWTWKSKNVTNGKIIKYGIIENLTHYGPNLYAYEAYKVDKYI